jgi:sodium-independent sulfate anion transporter 11
VYKPEHIAHTLTFGILRLGWLIEFIPYIPISAFVTSAAITIISTQIPTVLGITGVDTRTSPYKVYVNTLKGLPRTQLDAVIGITSIVLLQLIRTACANMEVRQPDKKRLWSLLGSLRLTFAIMFYTLISFLANRTAPKGHEKFRIVGHIDKGG